MDRCLQQERGTRNFGRWTTKLRNHSERLTSLSRGRFKNIRPHRRYRSRSPSKNRAGRVIMPPCGTADETSKECRQFVPLVARAGSKQDPSVLTLLRDLHPLSNLPCI